MRIQSVLDREASGHGKHGSTEAQAVVEPGIVCSLVHFSLG
jgi:hypothetical protein